jgi:hypothetical protein
MSPDCLSFLRGCYRHAQRNVPWTGIESSSERHPVSFCSGRWVRCVCTSAKISVQSIIGLTRISSRSCSNRASNQERRRPQTPFLPWLQIGCGVPPASVCAHHYRSKRRASLRRSGRPDRVSKRFQSGFLGNSPENNALFQMLNANASYMKRIHTCEK